MKKLDKDTWVRVGEVLLVMTVLTGIVMWAGSVSWTAANAEKMNEKQAVQIEENRKSIDENQKTNLHLLREIDGNVKKIEGYLRIK